MNAPGFQEIVRLLISKARPKIPISTAVSNIFYFSLFARMLANDYVRIISFRDRD